MGKQFNMPLVINREGEIYSPTGLVAHADSKREMEYLNSLGANQNITTLTAVLPTIIEQKFYEIPLADFVDIEVGQGNPFSATLFNWSTGIVGGSFEEGLINTADYKSNANQDDIFVEPIERKIIGWKKDVNYNIMQEGMFAAGTQNMDYVQAKYRARKKEYDLGIQQVLVFGLKSNQADYPGLLTQAGVTSNTTLITKALSSMTAAEFNAVVAGLLSAYMNNCNFTATPNRFVIPASDYYGLTAQMSETYPLKTKLEVLTDALKQATGNADFKVLPLAYADKARNAAITGLNKNRYVLYNKKPDTIIMNIPLDFTVTLPGTSNGFDYTSAAYSRFTGVKAFRPQEALYFDF